MYVPVLLFLLVFCIPVDLQHGNSQVPNQQPPTSDGCKIEKFAEQTVVNCSGLGLTAIPQDIPSNVTVLDLSHNCIPVLQNDSLACLPHLKHLNISHSCVHDIQTGTFRDVSHLRVLNLEHNNLTVLQKFSFSALHGLEKLLLSHNNLTTINPDSLHNLTNLKSLELNHNGLNNLNNGSQVDPWERSDCPFAMIGKLETLLLHGNSIDAIDVRSFCGLFSLKSLDLSKNNITYLPNHSFADLTSLEKLNVANNIINDLEEDAFHNLTNLRDLYLQNNTLSFLYTETFYPCARLETLNISSNNLTMTVSKPIFRKLNHMKCLDLSNNSLEIACANLTMFQDLQHLEYLDMSHTGDIWDAANCSQTLQNLTNLVTLKLSGCNIHNIPSRAFDNQKKLQYLDLNHNFIHPTLPRNIFREQKYLQYLDMSHNELKTLPSDIFSSCSSTNFHVNLKWNRLQSLPAMLFSTLYPALEIDLSENDFFHINASTLTAIQNVSMINLSDNPFDCDCELVDFVQWAKNHDTQVAGLNDYTCTNGKSLDDFHEYCPSKVSNLINYLAPSLAAVAVVVILLGMYKMYKKQDPRREEYEEIVGFNHEPLPVTKHYEYDVFLIHSKKDTEKVQMFSARLEADNQYIVASIGRNLDGGCSISSSIEHFLTHSRTILGIITMNSLHDGSFRQVLDIARQLERDQGAHHQLKLIMLEDMKSLQPENRGSVFSVIRGKRYLKWPDDGREEPKFWNRLKEIIGQPVVGQEETTV